MSQEGFEEVQAKESGSNSSMNSQSRRVFDTAKHYPRCLRSSFDEFVYRWQIQIVILVPSNMRILLERCAIFVASTPEYLIGKINVASSIATGFDTGRQSCAKGYSNYRSQEVGLQHDSTHQCLRTQCRNLRNPG